MNKKDEKKDKTPFFSTKTGSFIGILIAIMILCLVIWLICIWTGNNIVTAFATIARNNSNLTLGGV